MKMPGFAAELSLYKSVKKNATGVNSYDHDPFTVKMSLDELDLDQGYYGCIEDICSGKSGKSWDCCEKFCDCVWSADTNSYICYENWERCVATPKQPAPRFPVLTNVMRYAWR